MFKCWSAEETELKLCVSCEIVYLWVTTNWCSMSNTVYLIGINPVLAVWTLAVSLSIHLNVASSYRLNIMVPASHRFPKWFIPLWFPDYHLCLAFCMSCPIAAVVVVVINSPTDRYSHTKWFEVNKKTEKLSKCKGVEIEFSRMWKMRTKIMPVIIGAMRTIKGLDQNFQLLPGHPSATQLSKIALMSTAHIISKVLG